MPSMPFRDRHGRDHVITGPELIDQENRDTKRELIRLRPLLVSADIAVAEQAEKDADVLFVRRDELAKYAQQWDALVAAHSADRRRSMVKAIDELANAQDGR